MGAEALQRQEVAIRDVEALDGPWLVVIAKAGQEKIARDQLLRQKFEVYLPMRLLELNQAKARGITAAPLFPRILFARASLDAYRWQAMFSTFGVQRVLCDPARPKGLHPDFVRQLRGRELEGFLRIGVLDKTKPVEKDHRKWVKIQDVIDGLLSERVDSNRAALLLTMVSEGRAAVVQGFRR